MTHRIAVIPGDGAGPEVVAEARKAVDALALDVTWNELPWGSAHYHEHGAMMPADALDVARRHEAVLLGAVGDPSVPDHVSLWGLLLPLRQGLDLWANIRPARLLEGIPSPLAGSPAVDMLFVRENTEGEYSGIGGRAHKGLPHEVGVETAVFTREGVRRVVEHAFELAEGRRKRLTSATKSNASRYGYVLWDEVVEEVAAEHPDVEVDRALVDALAARMISNPLSLDVVVASNLFGDVLTDIAAAIQGGMGMAASASLAPGSSTTAIFEPVHGSAPDIAGKGLANPIGAIWSASLMLEHLGEGEAAARLLRAVEAVCKDGPRTRDVGGSASTSEVGDAVAAHVWAWWREAAFYQIYVRSFQDSNGDGVGDLPGIRSRLPYLQDLGVDALWLTPFYPSPQVDHGYDVADYTGVDPQFGTLADFDELLAAAHELGIRITIDIVPNHTSDQHEWFRNAIADPAHPDRKRYMFRSGVDGGPPNEWTSAFGGPAWTLDERTGEYYLHFFTAEQPDLDWHEESVQRSFEEILRFWLDRGVDGFRIDVAHALFKDQTLPPMVEPVPRPPFGDWLSALMQPELHPLYRRWRQVADEYPGDRMYVGEIVIESQERIASYVEPDQLHLSFNFGLLFEEWDAERMRGTIDRTLTALGAVGAPSTWVFENHDVTRLPTRYGGGETGRRRARAAALLLYGLPGTSFTYQGQELGLEEVDVPDELRQDPVFFRTNGARKGRDGCRVPLPWTAEPPTFGFTDGEPWLPLPQAWGAAGVAAQQGDPASSLSLFRAAIRLRPRGEGFRWHESPPGTMIFERDDLVCAVNFDASVLELPEGELVLASEPGVTTTLPPDTAAWVRKGD